VCRWLYDRIPLRYTCLLFLTAVNKLRNISLHEDDIIGLLLGRTYYTYTNVCNCWLIHNVSLTVIYLMFPCYFSYSYQNGLWVIAVKINAKEDINMDAMMFCILKVPTRKLLAFQWHIVMYRPNIRTAYNELVCLPHHKFACWSCFIFSECMKLRIWFGWPPVAQRPYHVT
jgi:hypothetical protein